ncbi:bifunctional adenosylcobinamide kinase/adenosylcobinamide-phosphate guanylyltransferase [Halanaerobium sp. Z-7514]|uniref:Adenosylcobinamide kinase n=1 Tax=Halanaerobium polyolivorans TaxID=2886943 RepID=A0AAW4X0X5_9FIRM|nr:bifunctional adenosylcobinamide kinase/adenosylcobinamide-phosphate guanylyltransferase [Halanaerobium polyolivorans]MCC3145471.1 bifunctional adenosylcobinamide kinase/adenosylcobinamide-phosphate guanylyltransferase [Halanaerobium polyolivorans]
MGIILILGGARSGKSSFAELIAEKLGGDDVIYLASGQAVDGEMKARIKAHKEQRPDSWLTIEEPLNISTKIKEISSKKTVLFDCLTTYLSNLLLENEQADYQEIEYQLLSEVENIIELALKKELNLIIVHNEVGQGIVPSYKLGRYFRDISGRAARLCAASAERVYTVRAGLPQEIKKDGLKIIESYLGEVEEVKVL